jgi:UDP-N-acetyl-D-glucosamine dehydrogenase
VPRDARRDMAVRRRLRDAGPCISRAKQLHPRITASAFRCKRVRPMSDPGTQLAHLIDRRRALVGVLGLGYVGLPLARAFVRQGFPVLGFDTDVTKVAALAAGRSYIRSVPPDDVEAMRAAGFRATADFDRLGEPDALLVCVPTPLTASREPDLSHVTSTAAAIGRRARPGQLVVLESTTYPGTTRETMLPAVSAAGLTVGRDLFLAYSPEREDPGNPAHTVTAIPKVVGGHDPKSLDLACALYGAVVPDVVPVSSLEVGEACKILENTYRAVNIALVNELKIVFDAMGIDVWEVIAAAKTKPFGFQAFYPGPGLGGHCIPIDPFYLTWAARRTGVNTRFIELAGEVNTQMPARVVARTVQSLVERGQQIRGSKILLLGMAYKPDVDDPRESPGFAIMDLFERMGAQVRYHDPYIARLPLMRNWRLLTGESVPLTETFLGRQDAVIIVTDHTAYDWDWIVRHARLVVDTRNATRLVGTDRSRVVRA